MSTWTLIGVRHEIIEHAFAQSNSNHTPPSVSFDTGAGKEGIELRDPNGTWRGARLSPYVEYTKTLMEYNEQIQLESTAYFCVKGSTPNRMRNIYDCIGGLESMLKGYVNMVSAITGEELAVHNVHFLKPGATFAAHRDVHLEGLVYSVVIIMTETPPSARKKGVHWKMQMLEQPNLRQAKFGHTMGSCVVFRSQASLATTTSL